MKQHYEKHYRNYQYRRGHFVYGGKIDCYDNDWEAWVKWGYHASPKTLNALRRQYAIEADKRYDEDFFPVKYRKREIPNAWDDLPISRNGLRSWKDITKRRKQYKIK